MSEPKTKPTDEDAIAFLERVPEEQRRLDCLAVTEMMRDATGVEPTMWGAAIVGFGKYRYRYESGREGEWPVIGFSPRKNDLTLYVMPGFERFGDLMSRLGKHKTGKSCLYIKRLADLDLEVLRELIRLSVIEMAEKRVE
jgi:hypothetical protein